MAPDKSAVKNPEGFLFRVIEYLTRVLCWADNMNSEAALHSAELHS